MVTGSANDTLFRYAGQYTDAETGFQYLRARYYDPATGQFLTVDPLVEATGHPYAYAADNPVNAADPSGQILGICDTGPSNCAQAGAQAVGAALGATYDRALAGLDTVGRSALRQAVSGLNDLLTTVAQSDFSNGVNDAVIAFALSVQNLPASVRTLLKSYSPQDAATAYAQLLLQVLSPLSPLQFLQTVQALAGLAAQVKGEVDCKGLGYTLGYTLTSFVLKFAAADATGGLGKLAAESLAEGLTAEGGSPCGLCFPAGTLVATPHGETPIDQIHVGDQVLAEDPKTGKVEAEPVQGVIVHPVSELAAVHLSDGSSVTVTADHPFYVDASAVRGQAGWVEAGSLRVGDRLRDASGEDLSVTGVRYNHRPPSGPRLLRRRAWATIRTAHTVTAHPALYVALPGSVPASVSGRRSAVGVPVLPGQHALTRCGRTSRERRTARMIRPMAKEHDDGDTTGHLHAYARGRGDHGPGCADVALSAQ